MPIPMLEPLQTSLTHSLTLGAGLLNKWLVAEGERAAPGLWALHLVDLPYWTH